MNYQTLIELVSIPRGMFLMGSPEGEGFDDEHPQHKVTVPPFFMGKYPVNQAQWRAIASRTDLKVERDLDPNPAHFKGDNHPVYWVSWDDAMEFCERLSRETGREYRLPSEAEWEYACRGGTNTRFSSGNTLTKAQANCKRFYFGTTEVGFFPANAFGLYDMHGNVWEWCGDTWHDSYEDAPKDGSAWVGEGDWRVLRGGSWFNDPDYCRSAFRNVSTRVNRFNSFGFRVVCVAPRTQ